MKFEDSIRVCFSKYADFKGRAVRSEYWWWVLFTVLAGAVLSMAGETVSGVFSLLTLLPTLAVGARRLHDINRSGWWQLIWFLPIIGWILLLYWFASEGVEPNRFD
ncbi:DUF805 domain-containing protein [uncultured Deefgea sp.]|uniref:DUF805 domain-containing protein n=1 Tax=uncultured Deefgea sp. TaxID=1304914 RepID=UPI002628776C|nr:DUF805 domain-containing protein [uncultured Deefgea sp.]